MPRQHIIHFNIGGTKYDVSRSLLDMYPDSMLTKISSDRWYHIEDDNNANKEIFIERDGSRFGYVLDYLRDGRIILPISVVRQSLIADLNYYCIDYDDSQILTTELIQLYDDFVTQCLFWVYGTVYGETSELRNKTGITYRQEEDTGIIEIQLDIFYYDTMETNCNTTSNNKDHHKFIKLLTNYYVPFDIHYCNECLRKLQLKLVKSPRVVLHEDFPYVIIQLKQIPTSTTKNNDHDNNNYDDHDQQEELAQQASNLSLEDEH